MSDETIDLKNPDAEGQDVLTSKNLQTDQDVRWCPGCGDYSILKQVQTVLPEMGVKRENIVFVAGIGCSSRFPYYMETYGIHTIHGRATVVASGLKASRPELSVWVITGDGDGLSIGGNHMIHILRRNFNINILLFNNEIYGLTKGQYSPTSPLGTINKATPMGSIDHPFNPVALAMGADGSFVARTMDRDPKHLQETLRRAQNHQGTSFLEIYQNCNIFNDGAFFTYTEKSSKPEEAIFIEQDKPLVFGTDGTKGIKLDGNKPVVVNLDNGTSLDDLWIHDEHDLFKASMLIRFFDDEDKEDRLPRPFGIFYETERPTYEVLMADQISKAIESVGEGDLDKLIAGPETWQIK
ncbi:MAG: 2-oxoacid:ferredoxin oxidoreductase subunit beta [Bacteroidetes bacterium]|nr:2-oxoacid:ferredoxin oxidoreductase subunit beta [Bacteroidota bacterium]